MSGTAAWYLSVNGAQQGPFSTHQVLSKLASGEINSATPVWCAGYPDWSRLGAVEEFSRGSTLTRPETAVAARDAPRTEVHSASQPQILERVERNTIKVSSSADSSTTPFVIKTARDLMSALNDVIENVSMAPKQRENIKIYLSSVADIVKKLETIHTEVVPLDVKKEDRPLSKARDTWNGMSPGKIKEKALVEQIRDISPSLRTMYSAGLNFQAFYRYSPEESRLSMELGTNFEDLYDIWNAFKKSAAMKDENKYFEYQQGGHDRVCDFMDLMTKHQVVESYSFWLHNYRIHEWERIKDPRKIQYMKNPRLAVVSEGFTSTQLAVVSGNWLTAFVYNIIDDHLTRQKNVDFEIYSQVEYETAPGLGWVKGDFDVLTRAQNRILAVECKSGRLVNGTNRNDYALIADKSSRLLDAFAAARSEEMDISFWLVYNPYLNKPEEVCEELNDAMVRPLTPQEIRGAVVQHFLRSI